MTTIRPFEPTARDYARVVELARLVWPDLGLTIDRMRHDDAVWNPERYRRRVVVDEGDDIPAFGTMWESPGAHVPGKIELVITVHPDRRREGLATRLYHSMLDRLARRESAPVKLVSNTREGQKGALAMLGKYGFRQIFREPISTLDVAAFDPAPFEPIARRVREAGIAITTLAALSREDSGWERRYYDLQWEIRQDVPSPDPATRVPFDVWRRRELEGPGYLPEGVFVALDGKRWVGFSALRRRGRDARRLFQGFTGVARSHRRRGLATALKLETIAFARESAAATIQTGNAEENPMYQINLRLGFRPMPANLEFERAWEGAYVFSAIDPPEESP